MSPHHTTARAEWDHMSLDAEHALVLIFLIYNPEQVSWESKDSPLSSFEAFSLKHIFAPRPAPDKPEECAL